MIRVRVIPRARREGVSREGDELIVRVRDPPEGGRANRRLVELLAQYLGVPKSRIEIVRGHRSREKLIRVDEEQA